MINRILVLVLLMFISSLSFAQIDQSSFLSASSEKITSSNYYFAKPNELTIMVNVMGFVQRPGRYEISRSIDLITLMALAGGATADGAMDDVKITRFSESEGRIRRTEFRVDLEQVARVNPQDLILQPGDIIQLSRTGWSQFRDAFSVVVSAAIITTAVAQVIQVTKR